MTALVDRPPLHPSVEQACIDTVRELWRRDGLTLPTDPREWRNYTRLGDPEFMLSRLLRATTDMSLREIGEVMGRSPGSTCIFNARCKIGIYTNEDPADIFAIVERRLGYAIG